MCYKDTHFVLHLHEHELCYKIIGGRTTGAQGARAPLKFSASGIIFREADIKLLADSDERPPLALDEPSGS